MKGNDAVVIEGDATLDGIVGNDRALEFMRNIMIGLSIDGQYQLVDHKQVDNLQTG